MSSSATLDVPTDSSIAWAVLAASTGALLLLFGWALSNQSVLIPSSVDSLFGFTQRADSAAKVSVVSPSTQDVNNTVITRRELQAENAASAVRQQQVMASSESETQAQRNAAEKAEAVKLADLAAQEQRIAAEQAETARLAELKAEQERLAAEQAEAARLAEVAAEEQRVAAEQAETAKRAELKAEQERLAAEQAEAARLAEVAAEEQRVAAEQAEAARLAELKAEQDRIAAEQKEIESEREKAGAAVAATEQPDATQISLATASDNETPFQKLRREELSALSGLAARVRFLPAEIEPRPSSKGPLDRLFELLFLYSETQVLVQVASNEFEIDSNNVQISRERALSLVSYLIERGLDENRFQVRALGRQQLPFETHRVSVVATVTEQ